MSNVLQDLMGIEAVSDESGRYKMAGLRIEEKYVLVTAAEGFAANQDGPVRLTSASPFETVNVQLSTGSTVFGQVIDQNGASVSDTVVSLAPDMKALLIHGDFRGLFMKEAGIEAMSDSAGEFSIAGLPEGTYTIFPGKSRKSFMQDSKGKGTKFKVDGISDVRGVEVVVDVEESAKHLTLLVLDANGRPMADTKLSIAAFGVTESRGMNNARRTDSNGQCIVQNAAHGRFNIQISAENGSQVVLQDVVVEDFLEVRLADPCAVEGRVVTEGTREPVEGVSVSEVRNLTLPSYAPPRLFATQKTTTDKDGSFKITGLAAGTLQLKAEGEGFAPVTIPEFTLKPGESLDNITIVISSGAKVSGRVVAGLNKPVEGASVHVFANTPDYQQKKRQMSAAQLMATNPAAAISESHGEFALESIADGDHVLRVSASGFAVSPDIPFTVTNGHGPMQLTVQLDTGGSVTGRITRDGQPVEGAFTGLAGIASVGTVGQALGNSEGEYSFENVPAGNYLLIIADMFQESPDFRMRSIQVESGREAVEDFELATGSKLWGTITGLSADEAQNAGVLVFKPETSSLAELSGTSQDGAFEWLRASVALGRASGGKYAASGLPDGTYRVELFISLSHLLGGDVTHVSLEPQYRDTVTISGEDVELNIDVSRE
ncbi:carboxypeptidase regulatory-like domain-containing protein [Candidatus Hydrogenedentota bacterium]